MRIKLVGKYDSEVHYVRISLFGTYLGFTNRLVEKVIHLVEQDDLSGWRR